MSLIRAVSDLTWALRSSPYERLGDAFAGDVQLQGVDLGNDSQSLEVVERLGHGHVRTRRIQVSGPNRATAPVRVSGRPHVSPFGPKLIA